MRRLHALPLLVLGSVLAGCGPTPPLEIAYKDFAADVEYGSQATPAPAPAATAAATASPALGAPGPVVLPTAPPPTAAATPPPVAVVTATPAPTPAPPACPSPPPQSAPLLVADAQAEFPPAPHTYPWRQHGTYQPDATATATQALPASLSHQIQNVSAPTAAGDYTFDDQSDGEGPTGTASVVRSFHVVPEPSTGSSIAGVSTSQAAGLYLTAIRSTSDGVTTVATLAPPIIVAEFPTTDATTWTTAATDTRTQSAYNLAGQENGHVVVNACGDPMDTWESELKGTITGPGLSLTVDWTFDIATQYGGLIVRTVIDEVGSRSAGGPSGHLATTSTIDELPQLPPLRRQANERLQ